MGSKLAKGTFPSGHGPADFKCFGPPATKDGDFGTAKIADLGCFTQDGKDSNKYYHAAVVQSTKTKKWYTYFEWGRTGASKADQQFVECSDESDAQEEFVAQLMSKNAKRGQWVKIGGIDTLQAKPGKDCYLVRPMASRSVGLPDGKTITLNAGAKVTKSTPVTTAGKSAPVKRYDHQVLSLMRDLNVATVDYARTSLVGGAIPMQSAIDEARIYLIEAQKRVGVLGRSTIDQQVQDKELRQITSLIYSRIPKVKPLNAPDSTWILSADNIQSWRDDLDAFESALYSQDNTTIAEVEKDPYDGIQMDMSWIDPTSDLGKFLYTWWPQASLNRHSHVGNMKIKNAFRIDRHEDRGKIEKYQQSIIKECRGCRERPIRQPSERSDVLIEGGSKDLLKQYYDTNTALVFHGTRSVNVSGIMRTSFRLPAELARTGVVINGAMFGGGIYFADDWRKSDGYTSRSGSYYGGGAGALRNRGAFMFACDTVMGEAHVAPGPHGYTNTPKGTHCIFGKAGHSQVANNEWIVFKKESNKLKFLIEYDTSR